MYDREPAARDDDGGGEANQPAANDDSVSREVLYFAKASRFSRPLGMMKDPP